MVDLGSGPKIVARGFTASFNGKPVLAGLNLDIRPRERLATIGPASSGKTTFLRSLNRLNDLDPAFSCTGQILLDGKVRQFLGPEGVSIGTPLDRSSLPE